MIKIENNRVNLEELKNMIGYRSVHEIESMLDLDGNLDLLGALFLCYEIRTTTSMMLAGFIYNHLLSNQEPQIRPMNEPLNPTSILIDDPMEFDGEIIFEDFCDDSNVFYGQEDEPTQDEVISSILELNEGAEKFFND